MVVGRDRKGLKKSPTRIGHEAKCLPAGVGNPDSLTTPSLLATALIGAQRNKCHTCTKEETKRGGEDQY